MSSPDLDPVTRSRLRLVDFLVQSLADTPSEEFVTGLFADDATLPDAEVNEPLANGFRRLQSFHDANADRDPEAVWGDVAREHARLFLGGDPEVPPRETAHRDDAGVDAEAVEERYAAGDWTPEGREAADHVAVELAYVRHLVVRQADDPTAYERERAFLDDHLLRWVDDFAEATFETTDSDFYRGAASVLLGFATFEAALAAERTPDE